MSSSTHTKSTLEPSKPSLMDYMEEGRVTDWLTNNGKTLVYLLLGCIVLLALIYYFSGSANGKSEKRYLQAASDFAFFSKAIEGQDNELVQDAFQRLVATMNKLPELHAAYDGAITQILLDRGQVNEAKPFAKRTLERTKIDAMPFYREYATTTLTISEGNLKEALQQAIVLQQKMSDTIAELTKKTFGDQLFAFNLLRIAILNQALGNREGEQQAWHEWMQYAGLAGKPPLSNVDPGAFRAAMQQLAVGTFSLPAYIAHREKLLAN